MKKRKNFTSSLTPGKVGGNARKSIDFDLMITGSRSKIDSKSVLMGK